MRALGGLLSQADHDRPNGVSSRALIQTILRSAAQRASSCRLDSCSFHSTDDTWRSMVDPRQVRSWRLVGFENRAFEDRDFHNDSVDAGEIGAGHTITALHELKPTGEAHDDVREFAGLARQAAELSSR